MYPHRRIRMETPKEVVLDKNKNKTNVLTFPVHKRIPDGVIVPPEFKLRQTKDYLTSVNNDISDAIVGTLESTGINCDSEEFRNNMIIITLLLENVLYRTENIEHEFDDMLNAMQEVITSNDTATETSPED